MEKILKSVIANLLILSLIHVIFYCNFVTAECAGENCMIEDGRILKESRGLKTELRQTFDKLFNETFFAEPDEKDDAKNCSVKFGLFNKNSTMIPETFEFHVNNNRSMFRGLFDPKKKTKIIVHGWMGQFTSKFSHAMINAYLPEHDYNIILLDWSDKGRKFYPTARKAVGLVGNTLANFIDLLYENYRVKPEDLHLIGHSLGAHVCGVAGRATHTGTIGRITALDPAAPLFNSKSKDRLNSESAYFIDVIHTCGKYLGWFDPIGHADFYPNKGGPIQPGCGMDVLGKCSHRRAWELFAASVKSKLHFRAVPCKSWDLYDRAVKNCQNKVVTMGEYASPKERGVFYLKTNSNAPYGRGMDDLRADKFWLHL